ncbi:transglutaminase domain-containing protein [Ruminococcus flavefaciens]|uniref:transglutaminase domain-containing protein n=1 Tax=Ruminococcus flavefaciens TaxID=1265 RepID=UPI00048B828F|nr:hypothetical protein [Ruminococcus flavefaciens]
MKALKIMSMALLLFLCSCAENSDYYEDYSIRQQEPNVEYADNEEKLYDIIYKSIAEFQTQVLISDNNSSTTIFAVSSRVTDDNPEFFWTDTSSILHAGNTNYNQLNISPLDSNTSIDDVKKMCEKVSDAADSIIKDIPDGASDWEKILFVHDTIVNNTHYQLDDTDKYTNTVYGCLVRKSTQNNGYTQAFQYIMKRLGFECGNVYNGGHSWNYVRLDGKYYWVDTAWDDPVYEDSSINSITHYFFMADNEHFKLEHDLEKGNNYFVPKCDSLDKYYYTVDGSYLKSFDIDAITDVMRRHAGEKKIELVFADDKAYENAKESMANSCGVNEMYEVIPEGSSISYGYNDDKRMLNIFVNQEKK